MAIKTDVLGMVHEYPDYFVVGREKIREYATAIKADDPASFDEAAAAELGHDALVAPPTFISTLALIMQQDFFRKVDTGFETMQIVQVDQKFRLPQADAGRRQGVGPDGGHLRRRTVRRGHRRDQEPGPRRERRAVPGGVHDADGPRGRQLDIAEVRPETGQVVRTADDPAKADPATPPNQGRISNSDLGRCTLGPRGFPNYSALSVGF